MGTQVNVVYDSVDFLVGEKALVEALIEEVVVKNYDFVDCFDLFEVILELIEVGLEDLEEHVVEVILAELQHFVTRSISLREHLLDIALLGGLMDAPGFLETVLNILLEKQVPEDQLVLVYNFFGNNQAQRPLDFTF